jgi:hypothetical protein
MKSLYRVMKSKPEVVQSLGKDVLYPEFTAGERKETLHEEEESEENETQDIMEYMLRQSQFWMLPKRKRRISRRRLIRPALAPEMRRGTGRGPDRPGRCIISDLRQSLRLFRSSSRKI